MIWHKGQSHEWIVEGTKSEAAAFEARKRLELKAQPAEHRTALRFSELCELYSHHAKTHLKPATWQVRIYQVATLSQLLGTRRTDELSAADVDSYKRRRLAKACAVTVNGELRVLSAILTWAQAAGHYVSRPRWKLLPVRGSGRVRTWSTEEVQAIYAACRVKAPELLTMLIFLANTGCRKGEALACEWSWIDFAAGFVRIPSTEYWTPKSGKPREVPLSDALRAALSGPHRSPRWVFPSRWGRRYTIFPHLRWQLVLKASGIQGHPHLFRHTFASHFLQAVPDLFLLAQILGHSHQKVTELYSHLLPGHLERGRNAVNIAPRTMALTVAS